MLIRFAACSSFVAAGATAAVLAASGCSGASSGGALPGQGTASSSGGSGSDDGGGGGTTSSSGGGSSGSGSTSSGGSSGGGSSSSGAGSSGSSGGSSSGGGSTSSSGGSDGGSSGSVGPYPSGPYCTAAGTTDPNAHLDAGCVLPNTTWIGYADPTGAAAINTSTTPYASFSLDDARKLGRRYAMINLAEFTCPGCKNSGTELEARGGSIGQAGGLVIELLETDGFVTQATMTDLISWVGTYSLKNTAVKDPDGSGTPSLDFFGRRDQCYIVDTTTMTILQWIDGSILPASENSAGLCMDAMDKLLGIGD